MVVITLGVGGLYLLHCVQLRRQALALIHRARSAEAAGDLDQAAESLSRYLELRRHDAAAWALYARVADRRSPLRDRSQVVLIHEEALRFNPGDRQLERRCAEIALEIQSHEDALRHVNRLLETLGSAPDATAEMADLEDLRGKCLEAESNFDDAETSYRQSITHDPARIVTYDRLARLLRRHRAEREPADRVIDAMMTANPGSALAHVDRWRYRREFGPAADDRDIARALDLGPDEVDVLIAATELALRNKDIDGARRHLERGLKSHPTNVMLYQMASGLELAEHHADRAEAVARRGVAAVPSSIELKLVLIDALISQGTGKIEGKDGATACIEELKKLGLPTGFVQYLEGRIAMVESRWSEAVSKLESARAMVTGNPGISAQINLLLAECLRRTGLDEQRILAALQEAATVESTAAVAQPLLATELERAGRIGEAVSIQLSLVNSRPERRLELVRLLIRNNSRLPQAQRHWEDAENQLHEAVKRLPDAVEDLTLLRADLSLSEGKLNEARRVLGRAIQASPRSARLRVALAGALQQSNEHAFALKILDQADKDLGPVPALLRARVAYWSSRGGEEAKAALRRMADSRAQLSEADRPAFLDELGMALYRLGDSARSTKLWRELLTLQPDNLEVLRRLASAAIGTGDSAAFEEIVTLVRKIEGEEGTLWRYLEAVELIRQSGTAEPGKPAPARERASILAKEICDRRPNLWSGFLLRGQLAELENKPDEAVADYLRAIDRGGNEPELARRLVVLLGERQQFDQLDDVLEKLLERGVAPDELKLAVAVNDLRREDFNRAIDRTREVIPETSSRASDLLFLGKVLLLAGRCEEAQKPLARARELAPGMADVWVAQVQLLAKSRRTGEIPAILDRAAQALTKDQVPRTLALCYWLAGNDEEAARHFQMAIDLQPADPTTLRMAAEFYIKLLKLDKAAPLVDRLIDTRTRAPRTDVAWARRARALALMGSGDPRQVDEALSLIDLNLKENPSSFEDQRSRAIVLSLKPGRHDEAIGTLEDLQKTGLLSKQDRFLLARLHAQNRGWSRCRNLMFGLLSGHAPEAGHVAFYVNQLIDRNELDEAEQLLQRFRTAYTNSGDVRLLTEANLRLCKARKHDDESLALVENFSRANPDQKGAAAEFYEQSGFPRRAEQAYRAFVAQNAREPLRELALAGFLGRQNRTEEALTLCENAWKTCPPEPVAATSVAILAAGKNVSDEQDHRVEGWLESALRGPSAPPSLRLCMARLCSTRQRYDQTESIYREVLTGSPNNLEVLNNLAWLLAFQSGKEQEALEHINRAIDLAGSDATLLDTRAVVYLKQGKIDLALQDLHAAVELNPEKSILYFHLARALQMDNNEAEARAALQEAEQRGLKPENVDPREQEIFREVRRSLARS